MPVYVVYVCVHTHMYELSIIIILLVSIFFIYSFDKNYQYRYGPQTHCKQSVLPTCRGKKYTVESGHDLEQNYETVVAIPRFPRSSYFPLNI